MNEISIHEDTEAQQLAVVQLNGLAIKRIKNPSEAVQLAAVKEIGVAIQFIKNPSLAVQLAAVQRNGQAIMWIKNPSLAVQLAAVQRNCYAIEYIKNPSAAAQSAAVQQNVDMIQYIKNPSPALFADNKAKYAIIKCILDYSNRTYMDDALHLIKYLRKHNVNWPELGKIERSLNASTKKITEISIHEDTEAQQLAAVQRDGLAIKRINNPSEAVQLAAVQTKPFDVIKLLINNGINPSEAVQLAAVEIRGITIGFIKNPSEAVQLAAVRQQGTSIEYIKNPTEAVQLAAVEQAGDAIQYIKNPSLAVQWECVKQHGWTIAYIKNPSEAMKLAAVQNYGPAIEHIENPSEAVQLAAVCNPSVISNIHNPIKYIIKKGIIPSKAVQWAAVQSKGLAIELIENPTPEMQLAAVQQNSRAIKLIENPNPAVQIAAVQNDGSAIQYIENPSPALFADTKAKYAIIKSILHNGGYNIRFSQQLIDYLRKHNVNWPELGRIERSLNANTKKITEAPINTVHVEKGWRKRELGVKPQLYFRPLGKVGDLTVGVLLYAAGAAIDIGVLWKDGTLCAKIELAKYITSNDPFWTVRAVFGDNRLRGKGAMPKIYAFLVNNGFSLCADSDQSRGGQYIWSRLSQDPSVTVYAAMHDYKKDTWEYTAVEGDRQLQGNFYLYRDEMNEELKYIENEIESVRVIREKINDIYIELVKKTKPEDRPTPKITKLMNEYNALTDEINQLENQYKELRSQQDDEAMHHMYLLAVPAELSRPASESTM